MSYLWCLVLGVPCLISLRQDQGWAGGSYTVRSNASWAMVTWWPPLPMNKQVRVKTLTFLQPRWRAVMIMEYWLKTITFLVSELDTWSWCSILRNYNLITVLNIVTDYLWDMKWWGFHCKLFLCNDRWRFNWTCSLPLWFCCLSPITFLQSVYLTKHADIYDGEGPYNWHGYS